MKRIQLLPGIILGILALAMPFGQLSAQQFWKTCWSPDGTSIAFGDGPDIWMIAEDQGDPVNLTADIDEECSCPAFSTDGSEIIFSALQIADWFPFGSQTSTVHAMDIASGETRVLLDDAYAASFSRDGRYAVYIKGWSKHAVYDFETHEEKIYAFNGDSPPWFSNGHPVMSPDNTHFISRLEYGNNTALWNRYKLYRISLSTGEAELIDIGKRNYVYPKYSPDGMKLAFSQEGAGEPFRLAIMDIESGNYELIDDDGTYETKCGSWSPDAGRLCYIRNTDRATALCVYDIARNKIRVLYSKSLDGTGVNSPLLDTLTLKQNYPNPFNPVTTIEFSLGQTSDVKLDIYNISGQKVRTLIDQNTLPGSYSIQWNSRNDSGGAVSSGIYMYRLNVGEQVRTGRMILLR